MDDYKKRLKWLRGLKKFESLAEAARAYGVDYETYKKLADPNQDRDLTRAHADAITTYHNVSKGWLMFAEGSPFGDTSVRVNGFIGAGDDITLFDDIGESGDVIDATIADPTTLVLEVRGTSMKPLARVGDYAFFEPPERDVRGLIGQECAVTLQDGRRLFKIVERGSRQGLYDLRSYNADDIPDVEIHTAGRFLGLRRKR